MRKKSAICILAAFALCLQFCLYGQQKPAIKKSDLRVLYVGGTPEWSRHKATEAAEYEKSVRERMKAFEKMLNGYFNHVTVIHADDYSQDLSENYDVTVMDGKPKPILPRITEQDETGNYTKFVMEGYITEDFDRPMLTIGEIGEAIGRRIGSKNDWYCLCLDADAHHWRAEHPIFNGPFPVEMTIVEKPTPSGAFHYEYFADGPLPETIPMWKVQTKGYMTDQGFRVGMVARPWGYEDSPDAEYISSGVCAKTLDAVAIGRHGNYLHWGFAASPAFMTEEAQTVLANAIEYIAQFDGKGVIARKYNDRLATREYLKELKYLSTRRSYDEKIAREEKYSASAMESQKAAQAKKERGEELDENEMYALNFVPEPPMSFEDYLKRYNGDFYPLFGTDWEKYGQFYDENSDYFYSEGFYHIELDEDVKSLGIPNYDKRLLDAAIGLWESETDIEKAKRILTRYTLFDFASAPEWRRWFETYKDKIFFTEGGGFLFLIDSYEPGLNDYNAKKERIARAEIKTGETNDLNPVMVVTGIIDKPNGNKEIVVKVKVHPGYHIYATVSDSDPFLETDLDIQLPEGYSSAGNIKKPQYKPYGTTGTSIYDGEVAFSLEVTGNGPGEAVCSISYQCCDAHICFPPATKEYNVSLK